MTHKSALVTKNTTRPSLPVQTAYRSATTMVHSTEYSTEQLQQSSLPFCHTSKD